DRVIADADRERVGVEAGALACRAGPGKLVLPEEDPDVLLVALLLEPLEKREDADVAALPAVEQLALLSGFELAPGGAGVHVQLPGTLEQDPAAGFIAGLGPGVDGAPGQGPRRVGNDQRFVVLEGGPEPVTGGAGSAGVVEREERGGHHCGGSIAAAAGRELGEAES